MVVRLTQESHCGGETITESGNRGGETKTEYYKTVVRRYKQGKYLVLKWSNKTGNRTINWTITGC